MRIYSNISHCLREKVLFFALCCILLVACDCDNRAVIHERVIMTDTVPSERSVSRGGNTAPQGAIADSVLRAESSIQKNPLTHIVENDVKVPKKTVSHLLPVKNKIDSLAPLLQTGVAASQGVIADSVLRAESSVTPYMRNSANTPKESVLDFSLRNETFHEASTKGTEVFSSKHSSHSVSQAVMPNNSVSYKPNLGIPNRRGACATNSVLQILATFYTEAIRNPRNLQELKKGDVDSLTRAKTQFVESLQGIIGSLLQDVRLSNENGVAKNIDMFLDSYQNLWLEDFYASNELYSSSLPELEYRDDPEVNFDFLNTYFDLQSCVVETKNTTISSIDGVVESSSSESYRIYPVFFSPAKEKQTMQRLFDLSLETHTVEGSSKIPMVRVPKMILPHRNGAILAIKVNRANGQVMDGGWQSGKLTDCVQGVDSLVIRKSQAEGLVNDLTYRLIGCINHRGIGINRGHYVAYTILNDRRWILYNDEKVQEVTQSEALEAAGKAYLLFYARQN